MDLVLEFVNGILDKLLNEELQYKFEIFVFFDNSSTKSKHYGWYGWIQTKETDFSRRAYSVYIEMDKYSIEEVAHFISNVQKEFFIQQDIRKNKLL